MPDTSLEGRICPNTFRRLFYETSLSLQTGDVLLHGFIVEFGEVGSWVVSSAEAQYWGVPGHGALPAQV